MLRPAGRLTNRSAAAVSATGPVGECEDRRRLASVRRERGFNFQSQVTSHELAVAVAVAVQCSLLLRLGSARNVENNFARIASRALLFLARLLSIAEDSNAEEK
ncbi:hypothetical protein V9T40_009870 [Parthenolecanium corni]|uniref:Uncharacterized protein n=1 Tax=Parthenolecanium corni TaxID=536013 RepID=A0AAN9TN21_9HEMI